MVTEFPTACCSLEGKFTVHHFLLHLCPNYIVVVLKPVLGNFLPPPFSGLINVLQY